MYENGEGVEKDLDEAVRLYHAAAGQGDADAQFTLGQMYENGEGVERNLEKAAKYFEQAAAQGHEGS